MPHDSKNIENFSFGQRGTRATVHIGLVNNMPDAALRATELQFARLLKESAGNFDVRLHLFAIPEIPRGEAAISRMDGFYADVAILPDAGMDALIITGAEPHTDGLNDEPYWRALTRLMDWTESGTVSTLFSCLAAHAAVLHFDGIPRRPLPKKISGVFTSLRAVDDPLLAGVPARAATPHSRKNGLLESDLTAHNYRVLTRLTDGSVDLFVREGRSRFVFLQGHPEYGADTLGREYLRDMARFLKGEGARPTIPENYFDRVTENALQALAGREAQLSDYSEVVTGAVPLQSWRSYTLRLFANWIASIASEKPRRRPARAAPAHRSV
ncbi:MAG: homoserine O-acetyltransferase/O-succinyltransferase family protein [Rhizomicrobium sp.]